MSLASPFTLVFNSIALALATGFLVIVLWYDLRRRVTQYFALFLVFVFLWQVGALALGFIPADQDMTRVVLAVSLITQFGFIGSSVVLYALVTVFVGVQPRRFAFLVMLYLGIPVLYAGFLAVVGFSERDLLVFSGLYFLSFGSLTILVGWRFRKRMNSQALFMGISLFIFGQASTFLSEEVALAVIATTISAFGVLVISVQLTRMELIRPMIERGTQLETLHRVSVNITQRMATDSVLQEIVLQAVDWLGADAGVIFLKREDMLELGAYHQLPRGIESHRVDLSKGVIGYAASSQSTVYLENYERDWQGEEDLPLARETFGSVICVPLIYDMTVLGVVLVISGRQSRKLERADADLLELLATQAAVAITYGMLFDEQRFLTEQLAIAHDQLRTVMNSTDNPVLAIDRDLRVIFSNAAANDLFDLEATTDPYAPDVLPRKAFPSNVFQAFREIQTEGTLRYEVEINGKVYSSHVATLGDLRIEGFVAVMNDITDLKELDRLKNEMVRMTSHDLKNPLQAAMANLELLTDDVQAYGDNAEIQRSVKTIERQLRKMQRIINGILDVERVRLGRQSTEECNPIMIAHAAVDEVRDMAAQYGVDLQLVDAIQNPTTFVGDNEQMQRALVNLLENAIKFNREDGTVHLIIEATQRQIHFRVIDTGIGIPREVQSKVFDRFYRGHQRGAEHVTGTGLGLSLVRTVVETHRGSVELASTSENGSEFLIRLPIAAPQRSYP